MPGRVRKKRGSTRGRKRGRYVLTSVRRYPYYRRRKRGGKTRTRQWICGYHQIAYRKQNKGTRKAIRAARRRKRRYRKARKARKRQKRAPRSRMLKRISNKY